MPCSHERFFIQFLLMAGMTFQNLAGLDANGEFLTAMSELRIAPSASRLVSFRAFPKSRLGSSAYKNKCGVFI